MKQFIKHQKKSRANGTMTLHCQYAKTKKAYLKTTHQAQTDGNDKKSPCSHAKACGGCQMLHIPYEIQLRQKEEQLNKLLGKFGKVQPILGMEEPYYYRNKVHAVVTQDRSGKLYSGIYALGTHQVVPVTKCFIENQKADELITSIIRLAQSFKLRAYDEDRQTGFLRHILIRTGNQTGEIMVVLVTASAVFPSKHHFVKALLKAHPEITTIVQNINAKRTNMVLGEKDNVLWGKGYIEDKLCGCQFRISPQSFYQVNPNQTEVLYKKAMVLANLQGNETVIDAYCGIGTIGIVASQRAKEVIGVELNPRAVKDAKINAQLNNANKVTFYQQDAGEFMCQKAAQGQKVDVLFMDPPRAGSDEAFLSAVHALQPQKVIYISCNPVTLKRDLEQLVKKGYQVRQICPVDMFPHTEHVECIVSLKK